MIGDYATKPHINIRYFLSLIALMLEQHAVNTNKDPNKIRENDGNSKADNTRGNSKVNKTRGQESEYVKMKNRDVRKTEDGRGPKKT